MDNENHGKTGSGKDDGYYRSDYRLTGKFWDMFRFTKDGKPKSSLVVTSFSLSILLMALYAVLYYFLADPMEKLFGGWPHLPVVLLEAILPAIPGALVSLLLMRFIGNKRVVPLAYLWLFLYAAAMLIAMLVSLRGEADARAAFLSVFAMVVPAPVLLGGGLCLWQYSTKYRPAEPQES